MTKVASTLKLPDVASREVPPAVTKEGDRGEIKRVSEEFESMFLNMVLKSMRDTVQKSGLLDGGNAEDIYGSMLDQEYTKLMAAQRTMGLADAIERYLLEAYSDKTSPKTPPAAGVKAYQSAQWTGAAKPATITDAATAAPQPRPHSPKAKAL